MICIGFAITSCENHPHVQFDVQETSLHTRGAFCYYCHSSKMLLNFSVSCRITGCFKTSLRKTEVPGNMWLDVTEHKRNDKLTGKVIKIIYSYWNHFWVTNMSPEEAYSGHVSWWVQEFSLYMWVQYCHYDANSFYTLEVSLVKFQLMTQFDGIILSKILLRKRENMSV